MASNTSGLSPIYHLSLDILWRIFTINCDLYWSNRTSFVDKGHRALTVLHCSSQVCRKWRHIILGSPVLWGKVVELDLLAQHGADWRNIVMERTKNARLCINGTINGRHAGSHSFFVDLLHNHWPRIRRFDVFIQNHYLFEAETWAVFQQPALQLEIFKLYFETNESEIFGTSDSPIFGDHAPVLREFTFPDTSSTYLSLQAPWLKQLHTLVILSEFEASEILDALGELPLLEYLELRDSILEPADPDERKACVSLPSLQKLSISNTLTTSLFFLKYINPPPGTSLVLMTEEHIHTRNTLPDQVIEDLCTQIARYTGNYLSNNYSLAKSVFVKIGPPSFSFKMRKTSDELVPMPFQSDFRIGVFSNHLPGYAVPKMMASMNPRQFTHATRLEFIPYMIDVMEVAQPMLTSLLISLPAVKVMMTSENGLKALLNAQEEHPDILPLLDTFWLKYIEPTSERFPEIFVCFLRGRLIAGKPITTINIADSCYQFKEKLDWGYLEDIEGLKVILRQDAEIVEEYVCGTGRPEKLDMTSRDL